MLKLLYRLSACAAISLAIALLLAAPGRAHREASAAPEAPAGEQRVTRIENGPAFPMRASAATSATSRGQGSYQARCLVASVLNAIEQTQAPDATESAQAELNRTLRDIPANLFQECLEAGGFCPGENYDLARSLLLREWSSRKPEAAAAWTLQLPEGEERKAFAAQVAIVWGGTDLPAAEQWISQMPANADRSELQLDLALDLARTQPKESLRLAASMPADLQRDELLAHAVAQWAYTDLDEAEEWIDAISDTNLKDKLVASAATSTAEKDPSRAATAVASKMSAGEEQKRAAIGVIQRWAQVDRSSATNWINQFPDVAFRDQALHLLPE